MQWIPFQNCIYDGRLEIQDGRPVTFDFIYLFKKYHWKIFNCEVEINVLKLRVAHLTINFVEGHQVQERNFKFRYNQKPQPFNKTKRIYAKRAHIF